MIRIGIIGATGYTGLELLRILQRLDLMLEQDALGLRLRPLEQAHPPATLP